MKYSEGENNMTTCVITGSGDGIGKAVAIELCKRKYFRNYALLGRNKNAINETISLMRELDSDANINFYEIDLAMPELLSDIVRSVHRDFGEINCLLNIAGYTDPQPLLSTTLDSFEKTYRVNVFSPFMLIKECTKYMKRVGGKVLNVASTAGMTPRPGWLSYASSKASVIAMSETLTEELAEYGIMVYCVSPGRCATKLRKTLAPDEDASTIMQPGEVAKIICNLISTNECCLDGQNIVIRKQLGR